MKHNTTYTINTDDKRRTVVPNKANCIGLVQRLRPPARKWSRPDSYHSAARTGPHNNEQ